MFVGFSLYSFTQVEYQLIQDMFPIYRSKNISKYNPNLCAVSREKIIYLALPHIPSVNSEQTHHTL